MKIVTINCLSRAMQTRGRPIDYRFTPKLVRSPQMVLNNFIPTRSILSPALNLSRIHHFIR